MINNIKKISYQNHNCFFKNTDDFFAKTRNGHALKDTYDRNINTLDICSNGLFPSNVLSNLAKKPFYIDDIYCSSIEGFLQSLKTDDKDLQKQICGMFGGSAKKISKKLDRWKEKQILYWQGKEFQRNSSEYIDLLKKVYRKCCEMNPIFKKALISTKGMILSHKMGKSNQQETVLTAKEFTDILTSLREECS